MRRLVIAAAFIAAISISLAQEKEPEAMIPRGYSAERYNGFAIRNPFVFPSVPAPPAPPGPSIFDKLVLESWAQTGTGTNEAVVFVRHTDTNVVERVAAVPAEGSKLRLLGIQPNGDVRRVVVVLSDGHLTGTVKFQLALNSTVAPGGPSLPLPAASPTPPPHPAAESNYHRPRQSKTPTS
jgi:hypothetical protein